jgi:DNA-binding transcriptional LysR family regulator
LALAVALLQDEAHLPPEEAGRGLALPEIAEGDSVAGLSRPDGPADDRRRPPVPRLHCLRRPSARPLDVRGALTSNDGELAHVWALEGAGLILKSIWDVCDDVAAGRLEVVLPEMRLPASPIHAVYPHSRLAAAKVRICVDFLAAKLKQQ